MSQETSTGSAPGPKVGYAIVIKGHLDPCWSEWFEGLAILPAGSGREATLLLGPVADQAALHGILNQIASLGLTLISVARQDHQEKLPGSSESHPESPGASPHP